ncbi:helicase HerA domain-containing protein [Floridanema evergladense]|uniref:Helicase HerA domain-containing protein n=1 Tax=Floridaenema evergladense BLCC-F167 TaxID=3153639 RepID=A0ABV4WDT6_9CYAN
MMQPTNINDYFNPQRDKKNFNSLWWCLGSAVVSVGVAVTIPMKPDFNLQSFGRVFFSAAVFGSGIGIIKAASEIDEKIYYREQHAEGQKIVFDNAMNRHLTAQTMIDDEFYSRFLPPEEQQCQQQEYQEQETEEYYPQQQAYQPNTNYQEYPEEAEQTNSEYAWSNDLLGYPSVLIWGPQGSGKTSFAEWLVAERLKLGHEIIICDPHREYGQWEGLKVVGDGMDYEAIDKELVSYTSKIKERYKQRAKTKNYNPVPITIICDEFTGWADRCEGAADFMAECLTDIRKVNMHALFIAHAKTNIATGGKKGMSKTKEAGLLELELEAKVNPETRKASPKLKGKLRYPGMADKDRIAVKIAHWMKVSSDFKSLVKQSKSEPQSQQEEPEQANIIDVEVREVTEEAGQLVKVSAEIRTLDEAIALVEIKLNNPDSPPLAEGKNREQIQLIFKALLHHNQGKVNTIKHLWGISKGGNKRYQEAGELYDVLLAECCGNEATEFLSQLATIAFPETRLLPASAGVYFVFNDKYELYYIGSSKNILLRWNSPKYGRHHRYDQVEREAQNQTIKIGWILTSDYERIEADLVAKFKPLWNGTTH